MILTNLAKMANLDLTMFEERKQYLENMSKSFGKYAIDIGSINSMSFKIFDELFPISLLEYAVQLIRNSNVPILWNLSGLYYFSDKKRYFYRKEFFWTLIGNQDSIYLPYWSEEELIELYEQLLQLISHAQIKGIYLNLECDITETIEEICETIKTVTNASIYHLTE